MKPTYTVLIITLIALLTITTYPVNVTTPYLDFRSQGINIGREFAGWHQHLYKYGVEEWQGSFFMAPSYSQSFEDHTIPSIMFGPDLQHEECCCDEFIKISGSQVLQRKSQDWLADYFGLPTDFESTLSFNPSIKNFILDLDLFLAFNWKCHNLFVQIHAPYVFTQWKLNVTENIINEGTNNYSALYMTPAAVDRANLLHSATEYFSGAIPNLEQSVTFLPLCCSKINTGCAPETAHHIADMQINMGTFVLSDPEYHAGVGLRIVIPTGTRPNGAYLFQPIVGNGHHWELGAHGNIYVLLWQHETESKKLTGHALANITYMFKSTQTRCFDLFDKPNSRYMLLEHLGDIRQQPQLMGNSDVGIEFQNELAPLANISAAKVFVGSTFQADSVFAVSYITGNFSFDFGYNYWFRGCEHVSLKDRCKPEELNGHSWALKGDAYVYGFTQQDPMAPITTVRLAPTEHNASIRSGTNNYPLGVAGISSFQNAGVDSRVEGEASFDGVGMDTVTAINGKPMYSSQIPFLLNVDNIDLTSSQGSSNKLLAHFNYTWQYNPTYSFFLGCGGEVEIGKNTSARKRDCPTSCSIDDCIECSLNQWGIWIKTGFSFE